MQVFSSLFIFYIDFSCSCFAFLFYFIFINTRFTELKELVHLHAEDVHDVTLPEGESLTTDEVRIIKVLFCISFHFFIILLSSFIKHLI